MQENINNNDKVPEEVYNDIKENVNNTNEEIEDTQE